MTPKFGINSPQTVKHISQKAFFKHALVPDYIYNIGTTVLNGGVSMVVFFVVNKMIFSDAQP